MDANEQRELVVSELNLALPFLEVIRASSESIEKADVGNIAKLNKLPHGNVDDVFGALVVLFANVDPTSFKIKTNRHGKVGGWNERM